MLFARFAASQFRYAGARLYSRSTHTPRIVIGIRREDPQRIWERRCPLTPEVVEELIQEDDVEVLVQPCERRIFKAEEFIKAGARLSHSLSPAHVILGIKETPLDELLTDPVPSENVARTHIMFSHTHKGQSYNIPLLSRFLDSQSYTSRLECTKAPSSLLPTLIDWELITDDNEKRTVGFGWYAGVAGALEGLVSTAQLHLTLGVASPFLGTPRPHTAPLHYILSDLRRVGTAIATNGTPQSMGPFVIVITGTGQVAKGALSVLREALPVKIVQVEELPALVRSPATNLNQIYIVHATQETYLFHRATGERATRHQYYTDPTVYESRFHELIAPYASLVINGVGWSPTSPRLMTIDQTVCALQRVVQLQEEFKPSSQNSQKEDDVFINVMKGRCQSFADISCDIGGGLAFLPRSSTLSDPFFSLNLATAFPSLHLPHDLPPIQVMAIDILPTALPLEASENFSKDILPYVRGVIHRYKGNISKPTVENALEKGTIASAGRLREKHVWLGKLAGDYWSTARSAPDSQPSSPIRVASIPASSEYLSPVSQYTTPAEAVQEVTSSLTISPKTILMLGSGMVTGPCVDEICRHKDIRLIIASNQEARNVELCRKHDNASSVVIDMSDLVEVEKLIEKAEVIISLLPACFHPIIAELCIKRKKHLVTASYISDHMKSLHDRAVSAEVLLLNEVGLDPGIDHCSALDLLATLQKDGKRIVSFTSFCGGLPAPESADVPLRYKFSWSPRGVLTAALNGSSFMVDGKNVEIPGEKLLRSAVPALPVSDILQLEGLPNRNSLSYAATYGLNGSDDLKTIFRGTLRYPGFSELMQNLKLLGLLDSQRQLHLTAYSDLIKASIEDLTNTPVTTPAAYRTSLSQLVPDSDPRELYSTLEWLSEDHGLPSPPKNPTPVIDLFAMLLSHKLAYAPGERDVVVLHHEVICSSQGAPCATRNEIHSCTIEVYGTPEHSAMALCVGVPTAMAALQVLTGRYKSAGVRGPTDPILYKHILSGLAERGIKIRHQVKTYANKRTVEARLMAAWSPNELCV